MSFTKTQASVRPTVKFDVNQFVLAHMESMCPTLDAKKMHKGFTKQFFIFQGGLKVMLNFNKLLKSWNISFMKSQDESAILTKDDKLIHAETITDKDVLMLLNDYYQNTYANKV